MSSSFLQTLAISIVLMLVQGLAALPWLLRFSPKPARQQLGLCLGVLGGAAVFGVVLGFMLDFFSDREVLASVGRVFMSILHLQLGVDFFLFAFWLLLTFWPKGGAVALAAFQEGVRGPMFWMLTFFACMIMWISVYVPYFTFGEDYKMVKELCYAFTMMAPALFGVVAACISVSDEIEGRTAVTLLSKPISRRQFLLGKFVGISLAGLFMTLIMGFVLVWVFLLKYWYDSNIPGQIENIVEAGWIGELSQAIFPDSTAGDFTRGIFQWVNDAGSALPGLIIGYCQVVVLVAVAVGLATRVPMIVNIPTCIVVYFLGHLTPIMTAVSRNKFALVHFMAQLFELILPGLDLFDVGSAIIRDLPLDPWWYAIYTVNVAIYAAIYTVIALLFGLIMFEDRDVA